MSTNKERTPEQWLRAKAYERGKDRRRREATDQEYAAYLERQRAYNRAWRERHPHYHDQFNKRARERMTPEDKKNMSQYQREWRAAHPDYHKEWRRRQIDKAKNQREETRKQRQERIRSHLPKQAREALEALELMKRKKKEKP